MGSWQHAGRMLRSLRENRGWEVPKLAAELKAKATAIGQPVPDRQSLVRMIYEWEAGTHRPRAYYVLPRFKGSSQHRLLLTGSTVAR